MVKMHAADTGAPRPRPEWEPRLVAERLAPGFWKAAATDDVVTLERCLVVMGQVCTPVYTT